ncbi:MAG: glycosyltransferase [Marinoscillum sp.]
MLTSSVEYFFIVLFLVHLTMNARIWYSLLKNKNTSGPANLPVSVIVCARNEFESLRELIPQLLHQKAVSFELIVVLDRCTDSSESFLQSITDPRLKMIVQNDLPPNWDGKKYAITQGINLAKHSWVVLTDADCVPQSENWLSTFQGLMNKDIELILGASPYKDEKNFLSTLIQYETFQTAIHYLSAAINKNAYMGVGRNIAYTREAFYRAGGFSGFEHVTGGDDDLLVQRISCKTNTRVNIGTESLTYSFPKRTWKEYLTQKTRHLSVGKFYRSKFKGEHTFRSFIHAGIWMSFLYLISFSTYPWRIIVPYGLLVLIKGLFFAKIATKTGMPLQISRYPVMDLIYAVFLPLIAIRALLERNIRWKK